MVQEKNLEAFLDWEGTDERSEAKARRVAKGDEFSHTDGRAKVVVLSHLINNAQGPALTG